MRRAEGAHRVLDDPPAEAVQHAHPEPLIFAPAHAPDLPDHAVEGLDLQLGLPVEILPGGSDGERPAVPLQQRHLQFALQRLDLLRDGGLGYVADLPASKKLFVSTTAMK